MLVTCLEEAVGKLTHPDASNERVHSPKDLETITYNLCLIYTYTIRHDRHVTHMHHTHVPHAHHTNTYAHISHIYVHITLTHTQTTTG